MRDGTFAPILRFLRLDRKERALLRSIVTVAACFLLVMILIKDGRVPRAAGLTGSCTVVRYAADGSEVAACRPGKLEGRPNLSGRGCKSAGIVGTYQYWECPAALASGP